MVLLLACTQQPGEPEHAPQWGFSTVPENRTCAAPERPSTDAEIAFEAAFGGREFDQPVAMVQAPGDDEHFYVVERKGKVIEVDAEGNGETVLDLDVQSTYTEQGLLGLAFHPRWPTVEQFFVNYTRGGADAATSRIARFTGFDAASEEVVLEQVQPYSNHNGGNLAFGPDGYLYAGFGDGGSAGDPAGNAQNLQTWLGKMLRLDVDAEPYAVPGDNPWADGAGALPEIYAYGLRNPWRYSFDDAGNLWVGDVGQGTWEEIDLVESGGNYGWDTMEGNHCYNAETCESADLVHPVAEYQHPSDGSGASVLGGFVYGGSAIPGLAGQYVFADTVFGTFWRLTADDDGALTAEALAENTTLTATSFAVDADREPYVLDLYGPIYKIVPAGEATGTALPTTLAELGCDDVDQMIPYEVNVPLWSDGAEKERWMALPTGGTIQIQEDEDWVLPIGTVLRKDFSVAGTRVETRLLVRHEDGGWAGYSYAWAGDEATLLAGASSAIVGDQTWYYPGRGECMQCHTEAAGRTLGLETAQLDREVTYANGATVNQLRELAHLGLIPFTSSVAPLDPDDARAYLHANCANCHTAGGTTGGSIDLDVDVPLSDTLACDAVPEQGDLDVADARIIAPGDPDRSVLSLRMHTLGAARMPSLATSMVDPDGTALVDAWIGGLTSCE